jgi:ribonuclease R
LHSGRLLLSSNSFTKPALSIFFIMTRTKRKTGQQNAPDGLLSQIIAVFNNNPTKTYNYKQVSKKLGIRDPSIKKFISEGLKTLAGKDNLAEVFPGKYKLKSKGGHVVGTVDLNPGGSAFVITEAFPEPVYISERNLNRALQDDVVKVFMFAIRRKKRLEGEVVEVLQRARETFVGRVEISKNFAFLITDSRQIPFDLFIPLKNLNGATAGDKAIAKIVEWPEQVKNPIGEIVQVIGKPGDHEVEMNAIMAEYELPVEFPDEVIAESEKISETITREEISRRRDFRNIPTFTIDPADAKDFDDALSLQKLPHGNWEVGVHIADVTHYVQPKSLLDEEALHRATSVYLVDRVIPMLPERLSNFICSLRPGEEKLCYSAVFEMNDRAEVLKEWFGRTIILSDHRFAYEDAQQIIEGGDGPMKEEILNLHKLALQLREERMKKGSYAFEKVEVKFNLDEKGKPLGVFFKEMKEANHLIEEFMLLANRKVAEFIGKPGQNKLQASRAKTFVYRIHDRPDPDKIQTFSKFIHRFGYQIQTQSDRALSSSMNKLLNAIHGKKEQNLIETIAIRSMAKAIYSTNNIGHYGLSFRHYTHFTSPIRRYPDMMVHRLLTHYLNNGDSKSAKKYEKLCEHSSEMEKRAAEAERSSIKYKQVEFMAERMGQEFDGVISGVTEWGIYVEIIENKCEGLVPIRELDDDFYEFDEDNYRLIGRRNKKVFQLGDPVRIKMARANLLKKQMDFSIVEP